jgi:hypothetical protein
MKKIIIEVLSLPNRMIIPRYYCVGDDGIEDDATTNTLLDAISELGDNSAARFELLLSEFESGKYIPASSGLADFHINEKYVWLALPKALPGGICISNEYMPNYAVDEGEPQRFTIEQFREALRHWRAVKSIFDTENISNFVGRRFEVNFPVSN